MIDAVIEACLDTLKLVPFLYFTYLFMEYLEHRASNKMENIIEKSGRFGPFFGAVLGLVPQCGFSSVAANFFSGRIVTVGTLVAIFMATSDEMLPIMIASAAPASAIAKILAFKLVAGLAVGLLADFIVKPKHLDSHGEHIHHLCEHDHCHCNEKNIFGSALRHTVSITLFILVISIVCEVLIDLAGFDRISSAVFGLPLLGEFLAGLIGLIPNCASSVMLTNFYLDGLMPAGPMMSGLLMNAGVGLIVLFKMNHNLKENIKITGGIFAASVVLGVIVTVTGLTFI